MSPIDEAQPSQQGQAGTPSASLYVTADEVLPELAEGLSTSFSDWSEASPLISPVHRRDMLKLFSVTALASATACIRRPAEKAIPYVNQPVDQVPGVAVHYASTCGSCSAGCGIVVKTREGRPVKIEGNPEHLVNDGRLCGFGQAQIQGLYHPERLKGPQLRNGEAFVDSSWDEVYKQLAQAVTASPKVGILTSGSTGNRHGFYREVLKRLGAPESNLFTWDANSLYASMAQAHQLAFGTRDIPRVDLAKANQVLGIGSDFEDVGISSVYFSLGFNRGHSFKKGAMGTFTQFESHLTLTGAAADKRYVIPPNSELVVALLLVKALYTQSNSKGSKAERQIIADILAANEDLINRSYRTLNLPNELFDEIAADLIQHPAAILAGGSGNFNEQSTQLQLAAILGNILCGAYGTTIFRDKGWFVAPVGPGDWQRFLATAGNLDVLFVVDSDPLFSAPASAGISDLLKKIPTVVSVQDFPSDVDHVAKYVLPAHHPLEAWGDEQPMAGFWSTRQPTVRATTDSRQAEDIFLWILAHAQKPIGVPDYRTYLQNKWKDIHTVAGDGLSYDTFYKNLLKRGFTGKMAARTPTNLLDIRSHLQTVTSPEAGLRLVTHLDHRLLDGRGAHLPVLQEIGDTITTIAWDTWVGLNPETMKKLGLRTNQVLQVQGPGGQFEGAAYPIPGLHPDAVVVPRGNGHNDKRSTISHMNGVNPLAAIGKGTDPLTGEAVTSGQSVKLVATDKKFRLAAMQKKNDLAGRKDIIKTLSLEQAKGKKRTKSLDDVPDLFPALEVAEHKWGMSIDLDKCNGCGACMAACALENNVPMVGREQILLGREMHWIRLDRYYAGDINNPVVSFQPVMCQHCNHAPCEAVCPVFATTHDPEGLNAMTYNRCVGTRYCANACPYKVRRFNWWNFKWNEMGERLQDRNPRALNPDVTVRTKGVMEKCTMCIQRLRDGRHKAKEEERKLRDGEIQVACQQTCPSEAISFGNLNDPSSRILADRGDPRAFLMLGGDPEHGHFGLKTLPNVSYLAEVAHELVAGEGHTKHA